MRLSLQTKTIAGIASIALLLLIVLIATVFNLLNKLVDDSVQKTANTTASLFVSTTKNAFLSYDLASLEADAAEVLSNPHIAYVRLLDTNGKVFLEQGDPTALARQFEADQHVTHAADGIYDVAAPIAVQDTVYGQVELGLNISSVNDSVAHIRTWTLSLAIIELILVLLCSYALGTFLMAQIHQLRSGTRHLAKAVKDKNYKDITVKVRGRDELSELADAFNHLVTLLKEENTHRQRVEDELKELNGLLEHKVKDRTALLNQKNYQLENANKDLKEAQVQLLQAEKMASIGQLAAGVAHEINNPVGFVSSNIDTLCEYVATYQSLFAKIEKAFSQPSLEEKESACQEVSNLLSQQDIAFINDDIGDLLNDSKEGLHRVAEIVKGLKLFSRIDSDDMQSHNINECVKTTLAMVNNQLKYICTIESHLGNVPNVNMNVGKISQVITNLLINAGQAIESKGKNGKIIITTCVIDNMLELHVEDTGTGISPSHLDKLFNPFFTTKPEGQGTGLGLSISFGIAQEHGGTLTATSKEGEGSTFILALPIANEKDDDAQANDTN